MKSKAIIPLVLGLGVGLFAVKFLVDAVKRAEGASGEQEMVQIVRAKQDIGSFTKILAEQVEVVETVDNALVPSEERIGKLEDVVGRVTGKAVSRNSPVLLSMLAPVGTPSGTKGKIPPGYRAVSVKIDEVSAVAYQLSPGDWVDVIVVMDVTSNRVAGSVRRDTIAEVILQNVQLLAIGRGDTTKPDGSPAAKAAKSATLLVTEADVPKLHLAGTRGKITLSMRGDDDATVGDNRMTKSSEAFKALRLPPAPVEAAPVSPARRPRRPTGKHEITIYKGTSGESAGSTETIVFENGQSRRVIKKSSETNGDADEASGLDNQEVE